MKTFFPTLTLSLLLAGSSWAADCKTTFDASCLAHSYSRAQVDADAARKQADIRHDLEAHNERLEKEAREQRADARSRREVEAYRQLNADMERRHEESKEDLAQRLKEIDEKYDRGFLSRRSRRVWR